MANMQIRKKIKINFKKNKPCYCSSDCRAKIKCLMKPKT